MADKSTGLVDLHGRPLTRKMLTVEQAAPTISGVRRPYGGHPAAGLTPERLARLLRQSIESDPETYLELAEDMEERDLHYAAVLSVRKRQVAGLDIDVVAAGDDAESIKDADLVREAISRDEFQDELVDMLDAIGKGFSASEIIWDTSDGQWMPSAIRWRDPRHFEFDRIDAEQIYLRGTLGPEPLKPLSWIVHRAKVKSGLTIRGGIARAAAWTYLFKSFNIKDWAIFAEAYGHPLRLGKYGPDASDDDKAVLLRAVSAIGADFAATVPESMAVEFVDTNLSGSHELYERRADWLDRQVSKLVLGQTGTTDAIAGGHAVGRVHDRVREDIEKSDARQLAATLTRDLAQPLVALNYGPRKKYPRITIGRPDEIDVAQTIRNIKVLLPHGLKVGMATVRDLMHLPEPDDDEELLSAGARSAPTGSVPDVPGEEATPMVRRPDALHAFKADSISQAVDNLLSDDGWEALFAPMVDDLRAALEQADTPEAARQVLYDAFAGMDISTLSEHLANLMFSARLAGEADEAI